MTSNEPLVQSLLQRLRILEDKDALWTLMNRYCNVVDNRDFKAFANMYTEDGVMEFEEWGQIKGREQIEKITSVEGAFQGLQHNLTNLQFEVDGSDEATGSAYLSFYATPDLSKPEVNYAFGGPYKFSFRRTAAGWKVARHNLRKNWSQGVDTTGHFTAK
ncbi:uncharacterized protein N7511_006671 [Penicillium nucicola]|uniref:uncharacterized protein n=1 Tax=Penicillium nucicola TaxID=1850975 RepID=UPI002545A6BF|nr:uncharacterized protein N7511_006671 [Penicillium nucicola]KAJ5757977.1 hypothetical protein N7511_006671 [Penicillium nucicola]